jgi:insulysin
MKLKTHILILSITLFLGSLLVAAPLAEKHPLDNSESRTFVLDNGMKVLLVSDPDLNISSASIAIDAGSYNDPEEVQGLAHFLEHMLFLGTEKYPDEGEYTEYLTQNGGYSNAYTAGDHTNYHFEVYPVAFEGALDRFSQFFIAPLFTAEFAERERYAVDSEFEKNLESDAWRGFRMFALHTREGHPEHSFNIGNHDSLANATREQLIDFFNHYYSANQMALSLVSTHSLDQMESWVREKFSPVKTDNRDALAYPSDYLDNDGYFQLVKIKAIEDRRTLNIYFNTPPIRDDWDAKSEAIIGAIIGYEGKGSLLSSLKAENLATTLGSSIWDETGDYSTLVMQVGLTPEGQANPERVLELTMGYVEMLRQSPYPAYFYEEQATMARLRQVYTDRGEGAQRSVDLANRALRQPLEFAENSPYLYLRQDPEFYFNFLNTLRPENMLVLLSAKDVETDKVEDIFGIEYSTLEISGDLYDKLADPEVFDQHTLPQPNPFVPDSVELMSERPVLLIDEPGLSLYYGQDLEFQRPKTAMSFKVRFPEGDYTARDAVLIEFYEAAVQEYVNEFAYDALVADLAYSISANLEGVSVSLFGYTESAKKLLPQLVVALKDFTIEEERFEAIKERMVRGWNNARFDNAYAYVRFFTSKTSYEDFFLPAEKAAAGDELKLADVYALRDRLYNNGKIEAIVYGNITAGKAVDMARQLQDMLRIEPASGLYRNRLLALEPGSSLTFKDVLPTNNSVFRKDYILGRATPERRVAAAVLANLIQAPYYSEMRTRQQLGYVVWSFTFNLEDEVKLGMVIQSGDYDPVELASRSDTLLATFPGVLREMPDEAFMKAKAAVRSEIEKKDKTILEKAMRFYKLAYDHGGDWSRRDNSLAALDSLTREDVVQLLEAAIDPEQARYQLVLLFARQEAELAGQTEAITDLDAWKSAQVYREVTEL